jgi:hypothetical protein
VKHKSGIAIGIIMILAVAFSGCFGIGAPAPAAEPSAQPTSSVSTVVISGTEDDVSTVSTTNTAEPVVTMTDKGYILKDVPGVEDTVQVHLKAGKASFCIRLPDYSVGESYKLTMTSVGEPFTYRSSNEFSGYTGAGGLQIDKQIPFEGTYQISFEYGDSWEIEIIQ